MGTASMFGKHTFEAELDCPWMTADVWITFTNEDEGLVTLESVVTMQGRKNITDLVNQDYLFDLISEFVGNADYHVSDHGN
jgi:hypothetical protein